MDVVLKAERIRCGYGDADVLRGIDLDLERGDFIGVIGPNGSGKSTLLKALSAVIGLKEGSVYLFGSRIDELSSKKIARRVGVIPQDTIVNFAFSVMDIVLMGRTPHLRRFQSVGKKDLDMVYEAMDWTSTIHLKDRLITELSGGERQRVIIARALAQETDILFLDEPTSHLDINHQVEIFDLLHNLNREKNLTILCVSHDLNFSAEYCRRIMLLKNGVRFRYGTPQEIITAENIKEVYGADVVVQPSPVGGAPHIVIVSKKNRLERTVGDSRTLTSKL